MVEVVNFEDPAMNPVMLSSIDTATVLCYLGAAALCGVWMWLATHTDRHARVHDVLLPDGPEGAKAIRVVAASAWVNRRSGLLNHLGLLPGTGLWLKGAKSVHTRGMQFAVDVVFIGRDGVVLRIASHVNPGQRSRGPAGTAATLELAAGEAAALLITIGARLEGP